MNKTWIQEEGVALCRQLEEICPKYGCHVALTGGLLYKDGERKDCDIIFYRIRQVEEIDEANLFAALNESLGMEIINDYGFVKKFTIGGKNVDGMFPEQIGPYSQIDLAEFTAIFP